MRRWDSMGRCGSIAREGTEISLGVGERGVGIDEERDPMLIGVAGFLKVPTVMGVETLVEMTLGMGR